MSRTRLLALVAAPLVAAAAACDPGPIHADASGTPPRAEARPAHAGPPPTVVDVTTAEGHVFVKSAEAIPSGWTTFRLENPSHAVHFYVLQKMPDGRTVEDSRRDIVGPFQEAMDLLNAGNPGAAFAVLGSLPAWYGGVVFMGGPGLVSPGHTAETTVHLEPGTYVIECYVKTPDGKFHSYLGMIDQIVVTDEPGSGVEPRARTALRVSNAGIEVDGALHPGRQTVAVHFLEHLPPPALGNDVHLVRLDGDLSAGEVAPWMDWMGATGMQSPAPATFLGGAQEMPVGSVAYMTVDLAPGRYAWISERPAAAPLFTEFTVPEAGSVTPRSF